MLETRVPAKASRTVKKNGLADIKLDVVLEGLRKHRSVADLCREVGISPTRYYQWRQQVINAARDGLAHPEAEHRALEDRVRQLEAENSLLKTRLRIFQDVCMAD